MSQRDETRRVERRKFLKNAGLAGLAATGSGLMGAALAQETGGAAEAQDLSGKVAIVTGARNNLGRAYAVGLAERGADVLIHYHRPETRDQAEETARLVQEAGGQTAFAVGDLGRTSNVVAMFDAAESAFGGVDILINNAGAIEKDFITNLSDEEIDRVMNIFYDGCYEGGDFVPDFNDFGADGNGDLDDDEVREYAGELFPGDFGRLDSSGDGLVTPDEYVASGG